MTKIIAFIIALLAALGLSPMTARITDLNRTQDIVTIEMANGLTYQFYGCEDYCVGDYVSAILYDNGTKGNATDDIIVSVHYSGYSDYAGDPLN